MSETKVRVALQKLCQKCHVLFIWGALAVQSPEPEGEVVDWLKKQHLEMYAKGIVKTEAYEELQLLLDMADTELTGLAERVGMKHGHRDKFLKCIKLAKVNAVPLSIPSPTRAL